MARCSFLTERGPMYMLEGSAARSVVDMKCWSNLMGLDLGKSDLQPLQTVRIKKGAFKISVRTRDALGFSVGDRMGVELMKGQCLLRKQVEGGVAFEPGKPVTMSVSGEIVRTISPPDAASDLLISGRDDARILPVKVQEHAPDLLGPRFIDELRENCVVRHAVPGLSRDRWTPEALHDLEDMLCSEPFRLDPVSAISQGSDWVGWMTRNRILKQPAPGDNRLRESLVEEIFSDQKADGSWGTVPATAYAILRLLELGEHATDERFEGAAKWLLDLPEPPHQECGC